MGDPRRRRKKYTTPNHPWQKERIEEEKRLLKAYGLKNKTEIWKMQSLLRKYRREAKRLTGLDTLQAQREKEQVLARLRKLGLLKEESTLDDILTLTVEDFMERRLQTIVYRKGLAKTLKQARQFIVHEHVMIGDQVVKSPSHLVTLDEQDMVRFKPNSPLSRDDHPERIVKRIVEAEAGSADETPLPEHEEEIAEEKALVGEAA